MTKRNKSAVDVEVQTMATEVQDDLATLPTKSAKIRFLDSQGLTRSQIAAKLGIRYQHVRNVLITPLVTPQ